MKRKGNNRIVLQKENYVNFFLEKKKKRGNRRKREKMRKINENF